MHYWQGDSYNHDTQVFFNAESDARERHRGVRVRRVRASPRCVGRLVAPRRTTTARSARSIPTASCRSSSPRSMTGRLGRSQGDDARMEVGSRHRLRAQRVRLHDRQQRERLARPNARRRRSTPASSRSVSRRRRSISFRAVSTPVVRADSTSRSAAEFRSDGTRSRPGEVGLVSRRRREGARRQRRSRRRVSRPSASQVFPGFQPDRRGLALADNGAAYIDLESDLTSQFLLGVAGRFEHYSDFGSTSTGKVAARFEPS